MLRVSRLTAIVVCSSPLVAQRPWTAEEAGAAAYHSAFGELTKPAAEPASTKMSLEERLRSTPRDRFARATADEVIRTAIEAGGVYRFDPRSAGEGDDRRTVLYLEPAKERDLRTFACSGSGAVVFTEQPRTGELAADAAQTAGGARGEVVTARATGTDGRTWQPLSTAPQHTVKVQVIDEQGDPVSDAIVTIGPSSWFDLSRGGTKTPVACLELPASIAVAGSDGVAVAKGLRAADLFLGVRHPNLQSRPSLLFDCVSVAKEGECVVVHVTRAPLVAANTMRNEAAAFAMLKNIASAEAQAQASGLIDGNRDGDGEYAFLAELAGSIALRSPAPSGETKFVPPVLTTGSDVKDGCVERGGYLFQVFLPGTTDWVAETAGGGSGNGSVDPRRAERAWRCYAWPIEAGRTGSRAFFIDHDGEVFASPNTDGRYSGRGKRPAATAATPAAPSLDGPSPDRPGTDGGKWIAAEMGR